MKNQRKRRKLFKRLISGVSALALSVGLLGSIPASADDSTVGYKYTLFAYSSEEGAITSSAANFCVNGNIATNGTISAGQNFNVNGEKKEHANEAKPDLTKAINEKFFAENVDVKAENYAKNETNIEVKVPTDVKGKAELNGNIQLSTGLKAMGDIALSGNVLNKNSTVLFSENGNIVINTENANLTGLIYAPKGNIVIDSKNLNLNSVVMIANKITLNAPNININNSASMAKFVQEAIDKNGNSSSGDENEEDPEPVTDPAIYAYGEYNEETKSVDIEWYSNVTGEFAVLESMNGTDYTVVSKVSDDTKYSIKVASDFIKKFYKVTTIKDGKTIESIPFAITKATGKYTTELLDTDKDGLADLYEEMLGTDKTLPDTDKDGLTDYEEAYITNTNPTKYDSVTEGVSDADADNDKDGLTNKKEIEIKTDPNSDDTDGDNLKDGDELSKYNTDPTKRDTDGDELEDGDEFKFNCDPNKKDTDNNGIIDGKEKHQQTLDVVPDNKEQAVTKISVSMAASGNIEKTTTVESIMDKDVLCSNVVGLVGEPFSIESESSFDKATITFTVDKTKLGETEFDNLMFLWYDRENDNFVELETSHNAANSTVSVETTHFSEYMIVDSKMWFDNWREIESYRKRMEQSGTGSSTVHVVEPTATVVFSHCSDETDPEFLNQDLYSTTIYHQTNYRTLICEHLIDSMSVLDAMDIVRTKIDIFHQSVPKYYHTAFSNDKDYLKQELKYFLEGSYLTDNITRQIRTADSCLYTDDFAKDKKVKRIVFITDRDFYVDTNELIASSYDQTWAGKPMDYYQNYKSIPIYFVCIGEFNKSNLEKIARETGGKVFTVTTTSDVREFYNSTDSLLYDMNPKDSDGDGLTDFEEMCGVYNSAGVRIITDALDEDTDDDGLKDGDEMIKEFANTSGEGGDKDIVKYYYYVKSDPTKADTDGDGFNDDVDKSPWDWNSRFGSLFYNNKWYNIEVPNYVEPGNNENNTVLPDIRIPGISTSDANQSYPVKNGEAIEAIWKEDKSFEKTVKDFDLRRILYDFTINGDVKRIDGNEEKSVPRSVNILGLISSLINNAKMTVENYTIKFSFQSKGNERRVIIYAERSSIRELYNQYANDKEISVINNTEIRFRSKMSYRIAILYGIIKDKETDDSIKYDMKITIDSDHKRRNYSSYLWIDESENAMEKPIICQNDRVSIYKRNVFVKDSWLTNVDIRSGYFVADRYYKKAIDALCKENNIRIGKGMN